MVTRMVRHYDQEERPPDGSCHGDTVRPVLLKRLGNMEHEISQKDIGFSLFKKKTVRKELTAVCNTKILCVTFEQLKDTLVVFR